MAKIEDIRPMKPAEVVVPLHDEELKDTLEEVDAPEESEDLDGFTPPSEEEPEADDVPAEEETPEDSTAPEEVPEQRLGDGDRVMDGSKEPPKAPGKFKRFFKGYWRKKKWTLPLTILVIIGIIFTVPMTRYPLLALGLKRSYTVAVVDSKTHTPVSGATITLDGKTATTDSSGDATIVAKVGKRALTISKQYYMTATVNVFVGVSSGKNSDSAHLVATGRQVPVKVINKITGKPVADAEVKVLDTEAKTGANGTATIVLPTIAATQKATVSASGYNDVTSNVSVTSSVVSANTFDLVPAGRVYFLSNLTGKIDVVSTNLDGSGRTTVLAGTGSEDPNNTSLLASTDWKYLALLSKRDGGQYGKLYLINTSNNDQLTTVDGSSTEDITLVGWSGHNFVYEVRNTSLQGWQSGQTVIKSYDADSGKTTTIDQTSADGTSSAYEYQDLSFVNLVSDKIVYGMSWNSLYDGGISAGHTDAIISVDTDGTNKVVLKTLTVAANASNTYMDAVVPEPGSLDIQTNAGGSQNVYYSYNYGNNTVTQSNTITDSSFGQEQQTPVTYLISPSGNKTFWAEQRDGKNTLFVGDYSGNNATQIASLSNYTTYGWYTDNYVLVEQSGSELYIMPATGGTALKISDYYKPPINYYGYGGGYGGL